jgi:putative heme-binding domain-containing protein
MWKLTDTNDDGVADQREMIVSGFDYTGNAADVHGPFLHPNGRLYWCHGRKGYKVPDKDGNILHEGKSSGIWSCLPDGSDVQWHSLLAGDNPVEVDFTPDGDVIGVQNLYYSQPRGDTLVHWLYGGVYERADQMKVIEGLPRTLETMPVMHNFGHVAVSGSCFWRSYPTGNREPGTLDFMVTHFNTQRVVRMELTHEGSTYKATENEFLKITHNPDIHFTDVMEDPRDGSLLVIDTGGWFRIGCPSSLMAKPDVAGAVYRIKRSAGDAPSPKMHEVALVPGALDVPSLLAALKSSDAFVQRRACEIIAVSKASDPAIKEELLRLLGLTLDPALEHAVMTAAARTYSVLRLGFEASETPEMLQRKAILGMQCGDCGVVTASFYDEPLAALQSDDQQRVAAAQTVFRVLPAPRTIAAQLRDLIKATPAAAQSKQWRAIQALEPLLNGVLETKEGSEAAALMLAHSSQPVQDLALRMLASAPIAGSHSEFLPAIDKRLQQGVSRLLLDAIKNLKSPHFDTALQAIANDPKQPQSIRLKALDAMSTRKIVGETFTMVFEVLTKPESSAAAKIQAAAMLARASHAKEEQLRLAAAFATVGPIELKELLPLIRASKDEAVLRAMVTALAKNPAMSSLQESLYRTALADKPTDLFEKIVLPAYQKAMETTEAKKRLLGPLSDNAVARGDAKAGRAVFAAGKGTCIACHKIGDLGRAIGPDLSKIGAIRTERDLLESILFPSNTLARDYEAHIIETSGGETITGVIRSHTAEGLLVVDVAGQERNVPHGSITGNTTLTTSLMPMALDTTLTEQEMLDLVAYLRSLR